MYFVTPKYSILGAVSYPVRAQFQRGISIGKLIILCFSHTFNMYL